MTTQKKPKQAFMSIRVPDDIRKQIRKIAQDSSRTFAGQILHYIRQGLDGETKKGAAK